jgi:hypothetical protein
MFIGLYWLPNTTPTAVDVDRPEFEFTLTVCGPVTVGVNGAPLAPQDTMTHAAKINVIKGFMTILPSMMRFVRVLERGPYHRNLSVMRPNYGRQAHRTRLV